MRQITQNVAFTLVYGCFAFVDNHGSLSESWVSTDTPVGRRESSQHFVCRRPIFLSHMGMPGGLFSGVGLAEALPECVLLGAPLSPAWGLPCRLGRVG